MAFPHEARVKLVLAINDFAPAAIERARYALEEYARIAAPHLEREMGELLIRDWGKELDTPVRKYLLERASDDEVLDIVESWFPAMRRLIATVQADLRYVDRRGEAIAPALGDLYRERVNEVLDDHDIAWQLVGEEIVARSSRVIHAAIIEPVMSLTDGRPELLEVETAFRKALRELRSSGDPADAVTDAARALEAMFLQAGARGNSLGALAADGRKRGLLASYDTKLAEAVEALAVWLHAERSTRGDAHAGPDATHDDAWLAVSVAGALILRLAAGSRGRPLVS